MSQQLVILTLTIGFVMLLYQRADPTRRKAMRNFNWFMALLLGVYVWWRQAYLDAVIAFFVAAVFNALFWILVGRYNPVSSSDEIKVLGMDD